MNRNQKIALGCGGAGCLGLIVVLIAGGLLYYFMGYKGSTFSSNSNRNRNTNININSNRSSTSNSNNSNDDDDEPSSSSSSASSMSDDDKHKLFQAASMTQDAELVRRVLVKVGVMKSDFTPGENYQEFISEHIAWGMRNTDFVASVSDPQKAREYVNEHFPE